MPNEYRFTRHALQRMQERKITKEQIEKAFWCGKRSPVEKGMMYSEDNVSVIIFNFCIITVY
jgi:hypothetical protein